MKKNSIYIHFPYCVKKCNYCDFISFPCGGVAPDLLEYYLREVELYHQKFGRKKISSIYFGGGTPSLMPAEMVEKILEKICTLYDVSDDCEITLEVNPKTVSDKKLFAFYQAGINRLSIGIQSLDDEELKFLGRVHSANDAMATLGFAKKYFSNISCDFIYAIPNQSFEKWQKNLDEISGLEVQHLSLYELIIEPKTPIFSWVKSGKIQPLSETVSKKMYEYTNRFLKNKFPQYEISNYSKKGYESRHNLNYWNGGDYIGIGVGAAGRVFDGKKHFISENPRTVLEWKKNLDAGILPLKTLSKTKRAEEMLIMGLRKNRGINFKEFIENSGVNFFDIVDEKKFQNMVNQKFLISCESSVRASVKGRSVLDAVIREIIK
ncbi:MAG: radical SAM family heme chaperone HemW [Alphaproteobacteria bacterium]|nr:radical SAM family heme chaperone HemW [Alphaproteobacteria bacterium]